ncbi:MAG: leucine-rich repeat protein [Bacteroidaceae bacterium]|nr:leucine-rich repeat protein [Bacteroidaceae bacterium]
MRRNKGMIKALLTGIAFLCSLSVWSVTEVNVTKAGTLSALVQDIEIEKSLKLTGSINGTDVKFVRELVVAGKVTSLDLSEVRIVKGGEAYHEDYTTANDVLGDYMFADCSRLTTVLLPTTITSIGRYAFSKTGLREVDIPNSVTRLGGACFADCNSLTKVVIGSRVSKLEQAVFYNSSAIKYANVKPKTPPSLDAYIFTARPTIRVYQSVLDDYKGSTWSQYGSIVGTLDRYYPDEDVDSSAIVNEQAGTWFDDVACTQLKDTYKSMTDEELTAAMTEGGMPSFMIAIALKLKNADWAAYEQDFRIHSYKAYSDAGYWNGKLRSTGGSFMGNPTGIYTKSYEPLYVFVDADVPANATLYIAGCSGNELVTSAKQGKMLKKGLNIVEGKENALFYILYTADTQKKTKTLSEWPEMKIHIEGGLVNGYYDVARQSDDDYKALLKAAKYERFTVKGGQSLFNFKTSTYRTVWPSTIDKSICWFDSLTVWEKELMGICESVATGKRVGAPFYLAGGEAIFPLYYNNPNFAIEGEESDGGFANSASYRTCYNSTGCVRSSFDVSRTADFDEWCAAHECGHNNQGAITVEGGTEVSNNLFSNFIRYHSGLVTTSGASLATVMDEYSRHEPFFTRPLDSQMRMYWQLYLYYHLAQKNTSFYPTLFKKLREDPLTLYSSNTGCLKFVRKVCEVAQEDLTDFFTVWGFFEPLTNYTVNDYGAHSMTVRKTDINNTLAEIAKYPVKNREILFIEDRVENVPTTDFLTTAGQKRRNSELVGQCGNVGQFTDFLPGVAKPSEYSYLQADSLYALDGAGGLGFLMLDEEGKLKYAANSRNFCIPTSIGEDFTLYSYDEGGVLREIPKAGDGAERVEMLSAGSLSRKLSDKAIKAIISGNINGTDVKYLRQLLTEGNLASIDLTEAKIVTGGTAYYQTYKTSANTMGTYIFDHFKQLASIRLPLKLTTISEHSFRALGIRMIEIPDAVTSIGLEAFGDCSMLSTVIIGQKMKTISQGVFYNSPVKDVYVKALTPPTLSDYVFNSHPTIHVYASVLDNYQASNWAKFGTIVGDLEDFIDGIETIGEELPQGDSESLAPVYNLHGIQVTTLQPGTIYIRNGRKFMFKP